MKLGDILIAKRVGKREKTADSLPVRLPQHWGVLLKINRKRDHSLVARQGADGNPAVVLAPVESG